MTISVLVESEFISNFQRKANRILLLLFLVGKVQQSGLVLIAADQKGGVFAFDGTAGDPRWTRAANSAKRRGGVIPSPVIADSAKLSRLLLLSQSGVGAVDLTNGAIDWEKNIEGEPIAFAAVDFEGRGEADFVVVTNLPSAAIVLASDRCCEPLNRYRKSSPGLSK